MKKLLLQALSFFGISGIGWIIDFTIYTTLTSFFNVHITIANIISSFFYYFLAFYFSFQTFMQPSRTSLLQVNLMELEGQLQQQQQKLKM